MVFNTATVGAAVTPTVLETFISHYAHRKSRKEKPTADVSYHVGLELIRQFLLYASHHTVDDIQGFTSQWVPSPRWVRTEEVTIPTETINKAAAFVTKQLGSAGIDQIGGGTWWQWRRSEIPLKAEWIEMRKDYNARKQLKESCRRSMMYVHGGAYFFGSVDEHRYQMQRHARKLNARVLAPRYRLAPQFPFPCGLLDCLATYLHLLRLQPPETIILAGDSAGGGMILSLLVVLRDQGIPLPAGAVLLSPWVDLTHSFPSVGGDGALDYIPEHGFHQRPSASWPPPNSDDMKTLDAEADGNPELTKVSSRPARGANLSITIDNELIELKDQIQMYTTNSLLSHPLVSPVLTPTLGGLPPVLILTGGGELLRDEQIYLAHKMAAPHNYPSPLTPESERKSVANKYPPTNVQLQVWDNLCHVAPTLSFTRPAKYMYRSVAQFGAWALARAQKTEIRILDDDEVSIVSSFTSDSSGSDEEARAKKKAAKEDERKSRRDETDRAGAVVDSTASTATLGTSVGKAGDPLPPFMSHMIRQRVTRDGELFPLAPPSQLPGCQIAVDDIGKIKPAPVKKWLAATKTWNSKYSRQKRKLQQMRLQELKKNKSEGFVGAGADERPPPTALAGRSKSTLPKVPKKRKATGLAMWSGWGSKHDEDTLEKQIDKDRQTADGVTESGVVAKGQDGMGGASNTEVRSKSQSRSRMRAVSDVGQADGLRSSARPVVETIPERDSIGAAMGLEVGAAAGVASAAAAVSSDSKDDKKADKEEENAGAPDPKSEATASALKENKSVPATTKATDEAAAADMSETDDVGAATVGHHKTGSIAENSAIRPAAGDAAFPFKLARPMTGDRNPSMITLQSHPGVIGEDRDGSLHSASENGNSEKVVNAAAMTTDTAIADDLDDTELTPKKRPDTATTIHAPSSPTSTITAADNITTTTTDAAAARTVSNGTVGSTGTAKGMLPSDAAAGPGDRSSIALVAGSVAAAATAAVAAITGEKDVNPAFEDTDSKGDAASSKGSTTSAETARERQESIASIPVTPGAGTPHSHASGFDFGAETETDGSITPRADDETGEDGGAVASSKATKRPEMTRFVTADEEIEASDSEAAGVDVTPKKGSS